MQGDGTILQVKIFGMGGILYDMTVMGVKGGISIF